MTENPIRNYFKTTHNLLYSFLVSLPLFLAYEVLILISQPNSDHVVRISVDVWFKSILNSFGLDAISLSLMIVMLLGFFILYKEREKLNTLRARNFILMIAEAFVYSIIVTLVSSTVISALFNIAATDPVTSLSYIQKLALSLGAGLYEELFFRVLLVSAFVFIFNKVFNDKKWASYIASITLSAMLFIFIIIVLLKMT